MVKPVKISGVVITYNEEKNLARCLESMQGLADEIVVVDSYSEDQTAEIAQNFGAKFIKHSFEGHIEQKNFAAKQAQHNIILSLDADEAVNDKLADAIRAVKANWQHDAYSFRRLNQYAGKWIYYGAWRRDVNIRLFDRRKAVWGGYNPHDKVVTTANGSTSKLKGHLLHYAYDPEDPVAVFSEHANQINRFSTIWAEGAYKKGKKVIWVWHLVARPAFQFFQEYFLQLGFLDGFRGFLLARASAWHKYMKYLKLFGLYQKNQTKSR